LFAEIVKKDYQNASAINIIHLDNIYRILGTYHIAN